ncbi:cytochrome c biogenesis factor [Chthonomonas calidirosea]|uniref:Cytochrome c biogenesis factor n=1 Tax=Chthonomonas calidirosea (strain DSM 23976 / ICMP 18418 / T49) TaxID=1303518 RepID=S0EWL2_CHTCT|nr:tetratricopeptide repeat protein [Chthonomonas calidirosea]CCW34739.1 Cytochrome c biogenesis factor [Chthonomonas calidirosea T49]CEK13932.1 cytochrome c biogenesis factor [Chthonomonas calidirosea]
MKLPWSPSQIVRPLIIVFLTLCGVALIIAENNIARNSWLEHASTSELETQAAHHPDDELLVRTLCYRLVGEGKAQKATALMQQLVARHPSSSEDWLGLGQCAASANQIVRAYYAYQNAYRLDHHNAEALVRAGQIETRAGLYADGLRDIEKAIAINPRLNFDHTDYITCLTRYQRWNEAWQQLLAAIDQNPMEEELYSDLVKIAPHVGGLAKAEELLRRRIEMTPAYDTPKIHGLLALILLKEAHSSKDLLDSAKEAQKESWTPLRCQAGAEIFLACHDLTHAQKLVEEGLNVNPSDTDLLRILQTIYLMEHRIVAAQNVEKKIALSQNVTPTIIHLQELVMKNPNKPAIALQLARALLQHGNYAAAAEAYLQVLHYDPHNQEALYQLPFCRQKAMEALDTTARKKNLT